jgi:hypothetical protein
MNGRSTRPKTLLTPTNAISSFNKSQISSLLVDVIICDRDALAKLFTERHHPYL